LAIVVWPDAMTEPVSVDAVVARVSTSRRYRWVAEAVVARLAAEEIPKSRNLADAEKRTKRRLHQIFGAYTGQLDYARLLLDIARARSSGDEQALRVACRAALAQHASTRERLPILDQFYARIFTVTGAPATVVDIACGLNPLALPWMGLPPGCRYLAYDIDAAMLNFVAGFLDLIGVDHRVCLRDVVADPPDDACDVALLLKTVPCLDQQHPGAAGDIMRAVRARHIVVSFPTRSLGGHGGKGMDRSYRERVVAGLGTGDWGRLLEEIELPGELVFVVEGRWARE
jgi:16S rRNA (guanine(1405)-N(7))-methyltransferase